MQANSWQAQAAEFSTALLRPEAAVPSGASISSPKRFGVYRNNVNLSLIKALEANFPAIRKLLGGAEFLRIATAHVRAHPPKSPLMFTYGQDFAAALEADPQLAAYPYLADVARLEMLWLQSYHEADAPMLEGAALAALGEDVFEARLVPRPALRMFSSSFAVHSIFASNREDGDMSRIDLGKPECVVMTRPQFEVQVYAVEPGTFAFVHALASGATLADAAEDAAHPSRPGQKEHPHAEVPAQPASKHAPQAQPFDLQSAIAFTLQSGAFQTLQQENSL